MLKVKNLYKKFQYPINELNIIGKLILKSKFSNQLKKNEFFALENINFEAEDDDKIFVLGGAASGKTTLYSVLSKIIDFDSGSIECSNSIFSSPLKPIPQNLIPRMSLNGFIDFLISFHIKDLNFDYRSLREDILNIIEIEKKYSYRNFYDFNQIIHIQIILFLATISSQKIFLFDNYNIYSNSINKQLVDKFLKNNKCLSIFFDCANLDLIVDNASKILLLEDGKIKKFDNIKHFTKNEIEEIIKTTKNENEFIDVDGNE